VAAFHHWCLDTASFASMLGVVSRVWAVGESEG
jgi:hypothetical protein